MTILTFKFGTIVACMFALCTVAEVLTTGSQNAKHFVGTSTQVYNSVATNLTTESSEPSKKPKSYKFQSRGMDVGFYSIDVALDYALLQANSSLLELNSLYHPVNGFSTYIDALVKNSTDLLRENIKNANSIIQTSAGTMNVISKKALRICEQELAKRIFRRLVPLYRRQISLLKQEVTVAFNKRVVEDTPISVYVLEDLTSAMNEALRNFTYQVRAVTPRDAPKSLWNADYEALQLAQVMEEYVQGREYLYRAMGVLPRYGGNTGASPRAIRFRNMQVDLPPTEVSVHILAAHLLGRDYRQDALSVRDSDQVAYSEQTSRSTTSSDSGAGAGAGVPTASQLRQALKKRVAAMDEQGAGTLTSQVVSVLRKVGIRLPTVRERVGRESEFAREMMMLPLSLRNPDLSPAAAAAAGVSPSAAGSSGSIGGSGGSKRSRNSAASVGEALGAEIVVGSREDLAVQRKLNLGPERFVRWDMEPLPQVRNALDSLMRFTHSPSQDKATNTKVRNYFSFKNRARNAFDRALNLVPALGKSYYQKPVLDYGPDYSPNNNK